MQYRTLGKSGLTLSSIGFGAWALGGDFGTVSDADSKRALARAVELGVNFFDTADVYGDGRSECVLGEFKSSINTEIIVATKFGRRLTPHRATSYTLENLTRFAERSLKNLRTEVLDLVQLHCPPSEVYYMPEVFDALAELKNQGKLRHYGVSVERVEEALKAIEYPGVTSVQLVYNIFRQRPHELFFERARSKGIGIIARLPLSSGLLAGRLTKQSTFEATDHRNYNRHGEAFDRGETFSGIPFETGLQLVEAIRPHVPPSATMASFCMRWILMQEAVTTAIPGAKRVSQVEENVAAASLEALPLEVMQQLETLYAERVKPLVHHRW